MSVILASGSAARRLMLARAGVTCALCVPETDEDAIKKRLHDRSPEEVALVLAGAKAASVSLQHSEALVIGADQMLECEGETFDKPTDWEKARVQLCRLRGRSHRLISAVAAARAGTVVWSAVDQAEMTMRAFSDGFLEAYLEQEGETLFSSVGAYRLEERGAQLFASIQGDYFTILGLPLMPLLDFLRKEGVLSV